ncbi:hypothetical protein [Wolbachia endosymbiont of Pentalonia nigronervosa]|uniref:hypothetical protein n=1 Tax=Wolbachia endosymbiont of Pentalonia nigronervosa TaxID=1301914 RepID=UPI00165F891A|nr:hypothetical protein [Wolbachia endosymbiont of Pentalonia nigronervosa]
MMKIRGLKILLNRVRLAWTDLIAKVKSLFSLSNKNNVPPDTSANDHTKSKGKETQVINLENKRDNIVSELDEEVFYDAVETLSDNLEDPKQNEDDDEQIVWYDAVENIEENVNAQVIYAGDKFYSANKDLQEVDTITDHEKTFAVALYGLEITPASGVILNSGMLNKLTDLQFIDGKCVVNFGQVSAESSNIRLFMPFFFKNRTQMSTRDLFQYRDKNGVIRMPDVVILINQSDNINLEPTNLGWGVSRAWSHIKASEAEKSTRITPTLFPTFEIELSEEQGKQTLNFVFKQAAVPDIMEDLKKEKPTLRRILAIPFSKGFIMSWVNSILDAVMTAPKGTNGEKVTNFHLRDVFMNGTILNESQKQTNAELNGQQQAAENPDQQHTQAENLDTQVKHAHIEQAVQGRAR